MSAIDDLIALHCSDGVQYAALGDVGTIFGGLTGKSKADFTGGKSRYVSYVNAFNNMDVNIGADDFVRIAPGEKQRTLARGDVIFTASSETPEEVGMSSVITDEVSEPLYLNSFCIGYRLDDVSILEPDFAKYLFRSSGLRMQIVRTASGVTRYNVSKTRLAKVRFPIPPVEVQKEIVRILDLSTSLNVQLEGELAAELAARRHQFVHFRSALLSFQDDVEWSTLDRLAGNRDSRRRPVTKAARQPGEIPYYGASGVVDYVSEYIFDGDYLLVSEDGANLLARSTPIAFSISGKTWVNNHAHILEFDAYAKRRFVELYLNSIDLSPYITGSAQPKLNQSNLNRIPIPSPPLSEQERIVAILDNYSALVDDLSICLRAERGARRKQYEHYRDKLLTFEEAVA
ncbi:restriction endonuclease subunit S [Modestobacter altitudinis]|uniref:restriction endonuclease subunit S n=1 Tax=Modestobacter altitudinis TaxID=2213158 RepID=UPI00110CF883|nr:restriction endonuclease subunit S [Modestobacter altitudinis]